jgi:hypothetical protein
VPELEPPADGVEEHGYEIRIPKFEIRTKSEIRNPKQNPTKLDCSSFVIRHLSFDTIAMATAGRDKLGPQLFAKI